MNTGNVDSDIDVVAKFADLMREKGIAELSCKAIYIKMAAKEEATPEISEFELEEMKKLSAMPSDDEILMDPYVGLPNGGLRQQ